MNQSATIALVLALGTSTWTWWPKSQVEEVIEKSSTQILSASGQSVDPTTVATIRVVTMDDPAKGPKPFEVRRRKGQWTIPSHFDYPADGGTRVGETAGAVLNLPMGPLVTADAKRHAEYGVLDPLKTGAGAGAGKRVTLSNEGGQVLVDVIIGKQKENTAVYFVRRVNEDNVYTAKVQPSAILSTFKDWVETDLLKVAQGDILEATVKDYSVDEKSGRLNNRSTVIATKGKDGKGWSIAPPIPGQSVKESTVNALTAEVAQLRLVGVRPYSNGWLQERGFYVGRTANGAQQLYGNEGELQLTTKTGLVYHLFFGEIALGDDADKDAKKGKAIVKDGTEHNRYMAIFVQYAKEFDQTLPEPKFAPQMPKPNPEGEGSPMPAPQGPPTNLSEITKAVEDGQKRAQKAQARFQKFFYVISDKSFKKMRPSRETFYEVKTKAPSK